MPDFGAGVYGDCAARNSHAACSLHGSITAMTGGLRSRHTAISDVTAPNQSGDLPITEDQFCTRYFRFQMEDFHTAQQEHLMASFPGTGANMKLPHFRSDKNSNVEPKSTDEEVFAEASELARLRLEQCIADQKFRADMDVPRTSRY